MKKALVPFVLTGALALGAQAIPVSAADQSSSARSQAAIEVYLQNVEAYVVLRKEAAASVPVTRGSRDLRAILDAMEQLANAIRARRPRARVGDIFTVEAQIAIRELIGRSLSAHGVTAAEVIAAVQAEIDPGAEPPAVNKRFPWQLGAMMPPYLIADLPRLPAGLQYRIVGRDLVLLDLDSCLVVDILRDALGQDR